MDQVESIATTFGVDAPHLAAQVISFGIVCLVLYRFAYRPVLAMLAARREQIAQGLANTEKINARLAEIESERQSTLASARDEAARIVADARAVGQRLKEQETQRALASGEQILRQARDAAELDRARLLAEARGEVGRLVVQTTAAVAGRVLTPEDHQRLAEETARYLAAT